MEAVVKWKYRVIQPGSKNHTIDGYIDYVEKQVEERRNNNGVFLLNEKDVIGVNDNVSNEDDFQQSIYLNYINERKGSYGCFSDQGKDVDVLIQKLKGHEGAVWIPIVSLKEDSARKYGLDSEAKWMEKARELAEAYRHELNISPENYRWIAAFHSKSEAEQNPLTDSGCQPHLHFIIWEDTPLRSKYALKHDQIKHIRQLTGSVLSREYMEKYYSERNAVRDEIISSSKLDIVNYADEVRALALDINILMGGSGKLSVGELEKRRDASCQLLEALTRRSTLSPSESYYSQKLGINSPGDAERSLRNYNNVLNRLDSLSDKVMNTDLVRQWHEISEEMRLGQHDPEKLTLMDYSNLQKTVKNAILNEVRTISRDNPYIKDGFRGMLMERIELGSFKRCLPTTQIETDLEVITSLCKTVGISSQQALELERSLLERSQRKEYLEYMQTLIDDYYRSLQYGFDVTSMDFWQAMRDLHLPVSQIESRYITSNSNVYAITNNTILEPVSSNVMLTGNSNIMSGKDGKSIMNIGTSELAYIPKTLQEYEDKYNSLLDSLSNYSQSSFDYEKEKLERY